MTDLIVEKLDKEKLKYPAHAIEACEDLRAWIMCLPWNENTRQQRDRRCIAAYMPHETLMALRADAIVATDRIKEIIEHFLQEKE